MIDDFNILIYVYIIWTGMLWNGQKTLRIKISQIKMFNLNLLKNK